jgi:hypothetical protein
MRDFRHGAVEVTDEPTTVCTLPQDVSSVLVRNVGTTVVYLGGPQVCVPSEDEDAAGAQGFPLKPDEWMPVSTIEYDVGTLYAVAGKSGTVVFLTAS